MKILTIHNKYQIRGGEDEVREAEEQLLRSRGHEVRSLIFDNAGIHGFNAVRTGLTAPWSRSSYDLVTREIAFSRPEIVSVHNSFPLATPAVHHAATRAGVPVVQTLHNFRLICPGALLFRDNGPCEDCIQSRFPWRGIVNRCYRGSALQTSAVSIMIGLHRALRTWERKVSLFIAVSSFAKQKFVEAGFPAEKIIVKPNFVLDSGGPGAGGEGFVFVGRLTPEKGIRTLLAAMRLAKPSVSLSIVGDGPLEAEVRSAAQDPRIRYLGRVPQSSVLELLGKSAALVFPSEWYETFGRVAAEAFARGTPVIAAKIGAVAEIVENGRTGFQFIPGNSRDLAEKMNLVQDHPELLPPMRAEARQEFENKYTAERNYGMLIDAYERAILNRREGRVSAAPAARRPITLHPELHQIQNANTASPERKSHAA